MKKFRIDSTDFEEIWQNYKAGKSRILYSGKKHFIILTSFTEIGGIQF